MIQTADIEEKSLALVVVDMQNKFTQGPLLEASRGILPAVNSAISMFREAGRPVVFIRMEGEGHGIPEDMEDPDGFVPGLDVLDTDTVVDKAEMNAFCRTRLADVLRTMGVDGVVVCGLVSRWCVISTYFGAYDNDICPYLLKGGSGSSDPVDTGNVEAVCRTIGPEGIRANRDFRARPY
ncbi:MAG: isochorismatase family cysteine hydrolase [Thermoplasmata archaeon]|nr:isochorismatase family cysteine hydrolase [Thermoplasmata archaeon]